VHLVRESCLHLVLSVECHGAIIHERTTLLDVSHCHMEIGFILIASKIHFCLGSQISYGASSLHLKVKVLLRLGHRVTANCLSKLGSNREMSFRAMLALI